MKLIEETQELIRLLKERGFNNRDRLFRKLVEETGEYAEAIEFSNGSTRKVKKYSNIDPKDKLQEEICDIVMVALALASKEDLFIVDCLSRIRDKLSVIEKDYQKYKKGVPNDNLP